MQSYLLLAGDFNPFLCIASKEGGNHRYQVDEVCEVDDRQLPGNVSIVENLECDKENRWNSRKSYYHIPEVDCMVFEGFPQLVSTSRICHTYSTMIHFQQALPVSYKQMH